MTTPPAPSSKIPAYILAGGRSSRFGSDKSLAPLKGHPLILHIANQLRPHTTSLTVIADQPNKYDHLALPTITDSIPALGPIGGLLTALQHAPPNTWLLLTACDALILNPTLIPQLLAHRRENLTVIAFKSTQWEPLPALYHTSTLPHLRSYIAAGQKSLWRFIEQIPHQALPYNPAHPLIAQINTPQALEKFTTTLK